MENGLNCRCVKKKYKMSTNVAKNFQTEEKIRDSKIEKVTP